MAPKVKVLDKVLDDNGVLYLWNKIKAFFVAKEDGKGLSTNDYTDAEKTKLAGIEVHANYYKHPTGAGYSHIPVGGSSGQILRWSAAGTAAWGEDKDTTYTAATTTTDGLMSAADKTKLNGITTGANKYTHPTYTAHASGLYKVTVNNTGHVSAATAVGKDDITALGIPAQDTTYTAASQVKMGLLTAANKTKLDGIANGAEVNQNAFSTVQVGNSGEFTFSATSKEDKLTITAGTGVTITMDREKKVISINAHAHSNKKTLDAITAEVYSDLMGAKNKAHTHNNKDTLDLITDTAWNQVFGWSHTHENEDVLDATTASFTTALLTKLNGVATELTELWNRCKATFLPRSGGKMMGTIDTATYKTEITVSTAKSTSDTPTIVAGGAVEASGAMTDKLTALRSFVGSYKNTANSAWYNVISVRHRNGYDDGDRHGMVIYSDMGGFTSDLQWNRQGGSGEWQGARTLLDKKNYSNLMSAELTTQNLNDSAVNGICGFFYAADGNTCANTAVHGKAFFMFAIRISAAAKTQVAFYPHNNAIYMRSWSGRDWTTWRKI